MELNAYKQYKKSVLKDMHIILTSEEKQHLKSLTTEVQIDNYVRSIIMHRL